LIKTAYILVGVPGSGKSTWIENHRSWTQDCAIISTDYHVEEYARSVGKTYSEVFEEYMPTAVRLMTDNVITARNYDFNIIWDQTSTTVASRTKKFRMLPDYRHIAVVFKTPEEDELKMRLTSRPGKEIPWSVVSSMINNFVEPTVEEGYSEIWKVGY
jgi:predicted kinase